MTKAKRTQKLSYKGSFEITAPRRGQCKVDGCLPTDWAKRLLAAFNSFDPDAPALAVVLRLIPGGKA